MTTDDLAPRPEPSLFGFIKTKLPECLGGQPQSQDAEQPGLLSQQILTSAQITNLAQEGFANPQPKQTQKPETTYNPTLFTELEFYKSNDTTGQTPAIFGIISANAQSITGCEYLRQTTSRPTTDLEQLLSRQHTIQFLQQTHIAQEIQKILQDFKIDEPALYWLLDKKTPEMREVLDIIFFTKSWNRALNKNTGFITAYFYFIMVFNPLWGLAGPLVLLLIPFLVSRYLMHVPIQFTTYLETLKSTLFGDKFFAMLIMGRQIFNTLSGGGPAGDDNPNLNPSARMRNALINKGFDLITSEFGRWLYLAVVLGGYLWSVYNQIVVSYNFNKLINFIHDRLNKYRRVIDNVKSIIRICDRADHTGLRCLEFSQLSAECIQLINTHPVIQLIANDPVFLQDPGFFTNKGAIIKAFYQLELETTPSASKTIIWPFLRLLGYMDGWHGIAYLTRSVHNTSGFVISLAQYDLASTRPILHLVEEYTPVCAKCIPNSINMGGQQQTESGPELQLGQQTQGQTMEPNNILLTGPNGSGKSTFLKSVMTNIILAQTLGIAFAKEIRLTPFQYLSTYLNIPDCQGRESLFQAEMTRCHQHLELLRNLEQRPARLGFSFNIMDEIFVSTNYLEGMSGAYAVIKHLGTLQNSCHIITTHFDKLTISDGQLLTQNTIPGYTNKYFRIDTVGDPRSDNPEIHKDYLLRDGVNDRHLALHLLKLRGFDEELVRDAKEMYSRLTSPIVITPNENNNVLGNIPPQETPIDEPQKDEINQILDEINSIEPTTEPSTTDTNIVEPSTEPILNQEAEKNNTINPQE
jgi:energy-coupling factor transporter ATP-binding protein EcfA2